MRISVVLLLTLALATNGQFDPAGGEMGSISIHKDDAAIVDWATNAKVTKGFMQISDSSLGLPTVGNDSSAIGPMDGNIVSLGDGGFAVLGFDQPIVNRAGYDFAVFENGFKVGLSYYLELAHVEVSKDGIVYKRFPSESLTDTSYQTNNFSYTNPEHIYNLAGKHQAPYGTLFDLTEVNLDTINFIRIIDVVGSVNDSFGTRDSKGRIINDPFPSPFESSGFDLDAVAVVNGITLTNQEKQMVGVKVFPTLVKSFEEIRVEGVDLNYVSIYNSLGDRIAFNQSDYLALAVAGVYFVKVEKDGKTFIQKICVY